MLATTYALSVTSTPTRLCGEAAGPRMYGTTYIVRPFIEPSNKAPMVLLGFGGSHPVVGWSGVLAIARADKGYFFRARHVARIAAMEETIRVRLFIQRKRLALANQLVLDAGGFLFRPIAPLNLRGASHARNRFHPLFQGRRHGTSSKFFRHASGRRYGWSNTEQRIRQQTHTETKSLRHG